MTTQASQSDDSVRTDIGSTTASVDASVLAQWPYVDRRRRTTDRRQETRSAPPPPGAAVCTAREQQIVQLVMQGMTNKAIALQLGIVEDTVKKHLQHIYDKLGVRRRALVIVNRRRD